jgi:hypothetical protein
MSVETSKLRSTKAILDAVIAVLSAVQLADATPAFERVESFDLTDWQHALGKLALNQQRAAVVIWSGEDYEVNREVSVLTVRRTQTIDVILTDRRLDKPVSALTGDEASPGVVGLKDLVLPNLIGVLLDSDEDGNEAVYLTPASIERGMLSVEDKEASPGRQVLIINLQAVGEWLQVGVRSNESIA